MIVQSEEVKKTNDENALSEEDISFLKSRGYHLVRPQPIGEGNTRTVYLAQFKAGDVQRLHALKVQKKEVDPNSITTLINRSKKDLDLTEAQVSNNLAHPYIAEVSDSFSLPSGLRANAEKYQEGIDLETLVKTAGPIRDEERFRKIRKQLTEAITYLHEDKHVAHRDLKPSNILVNKEGDVKVTDLQNAADTWKINDGIMPTRGGTPYTHPSLINALLTGTPVRSERQTDIYALGATLFFALTGEQLMPYSLVQGNGHGKVIQIGNEQYKVELSDGIHPLDKIVDQEHESRLKSSIRKAPKKYRDLIYRCTTTDAKKAFHSIEQFNRESEKVESNVFGRLKENIIKGIKWGLTGAAIAGAIGGLSIPIIRESKKEPVPTMQDILGFRAYQRFSLDEIPEMDKRYSSDLLVPYMKKAQKEMGKISEKDKWLIQGMSSFSKDVHGLSERVTSAWLYSCYINSKQGKEGYASEKENRVTFGFVPVSFIQINRPKDFPPSDTNSPNQMIANGIMYLKQCLQPEQDISELYANYFASNEEIFNARVRSGSMSYLPRLVGTTVQPGYNLAIPYHERELINTAIALYMITDQEGNIDFKKIPELTHQSALRPTLTLPERPNIKYPSSFPSEEN